MIIVFNLWAFPIACIIYLVTEGIGHFFPAAMADNHSGWTIGIVAAVVDGTAQAIGVSGRIFLIPIWMWGIGMVCYQLGWMGTAGFVLFVIAAIVWMSKSGKKKEEAAWVQAQEQFARSQNPTDTTESDFWTWVKATLFLPTWMDLSPQLCEHNLRVLEVVRRARPALEPGEQKHISAFEQFLVTARALPKPPSNAMKVQSPVKMLVNSKLRKASKTEPLPRASALPPLIPAT